MLITKELPTHPTRKADLRRHIEGIVVHCTDGYGTIDSLVKYDTGPNHISKQGCPTVTYHAVIPNESFANQTAKDGSKFDAPLGCAVLGVPENVVAFHSVGYNQTHLAVALMYKVDEQWEAGKSKAPLKKHQVKPEAFEALYEVLVHWCLKYRLEPKRVVGHREITRGKTCPGMFVDLKALRLELSKRLQAKLKELGLYLGEIDGDFGPKSRAALSEVR